MRILFIVPSLVIGLAFTSCGGDGDTAEIDTSEIIESDADYEDGDQDGDGKVSYEEQSPHSAITTRTTNYTQRADSLRASRDSLLITPKYTDNEYESAFSTATTNPRNQSEGGVHPGNPEKRKQ